MLALKRLISLCLVWPAALAVALGGPVHFLVAHAPAGGSHNHAEAHAAAAECHHHHAPQDSQDSDEQPLDHSSHSCPVCVLLCLGGTLPTISADLAGDEPAWGIANSFDSLDLPTADQQLAAARAPPALAM